MLRSVFGKIVWERQRGLLWWVGGLVALALITVAFVPTLRDQAGFVELFESLPQGFLSMFGVESAADLVTPVGLINSRLYASVGSIVIIILAISVATRSIAGEEESGVLDMLLAQPVTRTRVVLDTVAAMIVLTGILAVALAVTLLMTNPVFDLDLTVSGIIGANFGVLLLALVYGTLALLVAAATGNRAVTLGVATAVVIGGFFINGLSELVTELRGVAAFMPFKWFLEPNPLATGVDWGSIVLMAAVSAAFTILAVVAFNRRDIAT